jgi:heterodisulfide reductase subunit A-like polyferredoxin
LVFWDVGLVTVDKVRCSYCGGCVSVCPVGAITLKETHLEIDNSCIDCGLCIPTCPMGAIAAEASAVPTVVITLPASGYDVVVVGAGPAGSIAARTVAEAGLSVLLVEKRQEIGSPVRCAEGVGHELLTAFIAPDRRWVSDGRATHREQR